MGYIPGKQEAKPVLQKVKPLVDFSKGVTVIRPRTGPGSVRSLQKSYRYRPGRGGRSDKELYEEIYGRVDEQRVLSEVSQRQDIQLAKQQALTGIGGPKGVYTSVTKPQKIYKSSRETPISDLRAKLGISQDADIRISQRDPLYRKGGVIPVTGLSKGYAEVRAELGARPYTQPNVVQPVVVPSRSPGVSRAPRVMGGGVLPSYQTSMFDITTTSLFAPLKTKLLYQDGIVGETGFKQIIEPTSVESKIGLLSGVSPTSVASETKFIKTVIPTSVESKIGLVDRDTGEITELDVTKKILEPKTELLFQGGAVGSTIYKSVVEPTLAESEIGLLPVVEPTLAESKIGLTDRDTGEITQLDMTKRRRDKKTKEFKIVLNQLKTGKGISVEKKADVLAARKIILYNVEAEKYNRGSILDRSVTKERKLQRDKEQLEAYLRKKKPDIDSTQILTSIRHSSGGAIDESILLKLDDKVPLTGFASHPARRETISTGPAPKLDTEKILAGVGLTDKKVDYADIQQKQRQLYGQYVEEVATPKQRLASREDFREKIQTNTDRIEAYNVKVDEYSKNVVAFNERTKRAEERNWELSPEAYSILLRTERKLSDEQQRLERERTEVILPIETETKQLSKIFDRGIYLESYPGAPSALLDLTLAKGEKTPELLAVEKKVAKGEETWLQKQIALDVLKQTPEYDIAERVAGAGWKVKAIEEGFDLTTPKSKWPEKYLIAERLSDWEREKTPATKRTEYLESKRKSLKGLPSKGLVTVKLQKLNEYGQSLVYEKRKYLTDKPKYIYETVTIPKAEAEVRLEREMGGYATVTGWATDKPSIERKTKDTLSVVAGGALLDITGTRGLAQKTEEVMKKIPGREYALDKLSEAQRVIYRKREAERLYQEQLVLPGDKGFIRKRGESYTRQLGLGAMALAVDPKTYLSAATVGGTAALFGTKGVKFVKGGVGKYGLRAATILPATKVARDIFTEYGGKVIGKVPFNVERLTPQESSLLSKGTNLAVGQRVAHAAADKYTSQYSWYDPKRIAYEVPGLAYVQEQRTWTDKRTGLLEQRPPSVGSLPILGRGFRYEPKQREFIKKSVTEYFKKEGYTGKDLDAVVSGTMRYRQQSLGGTLAGAVAIETASELGAGRAIAKRTAQLGIDKLPAKQAAFYVGQEGIAEGALGVQLYGQARDISMTPGQIALGGAFGGLSAAGAGYIVAGGKIPLPGLKKIPPKWSATAAMLGTYVADPLEPVGDILGLGITGVIGGPGGAFSQTYMKVMGGTPTETKEKDLGLKQVGKKAKPKKPKVIKSKVKKARYAMMPMLGIGGVLSPVPVPVRTGTRTPSFGGSALVPVPVASEVEQRRVREMTEVRLPILPRDARSPYGVPALTGVPTQALTSALTGVPVPTSTAVPTPVSTTSYSMVTSLSTAAPVMISPFSPAAISAQTGAKVGGLGAFGGNMPFGWRKRRGRGRGIAEWLVVNPLRDLPGEFLARQRAKGERVGMMLGGSSDFNKKLKALI